jgi:regulator of ribosome biosynthesis
MTDAVMQGVELDVASLLAVDSRPGHDAADAEVVREVVEALVRAVFALPSDSTEEGRMAVLPAPIYAMPRAKPIPKERSLTKWEKYAKEKGIQKKKSRDRLIWNEARQDYLPRYGAKSAKSLDEAAILPHKDSIAKGDDPFSVAKREKNSRVRDNKKKQIANVARGDKRLKKTKVAPMLALDVAPQGPSGKKNIPKNRLRDAISVAQRSTASAGRFDKKLKNEPKPKLVGNKRKLPDPTPRKGALVSEKERSKKILDRVLGKSS